MTFEIFRDAQGQGRWRLVARNGRIIASSGEGFSRVRDVSRAVARVQRVSQALAAAQVKEVEDAAPTGPVQARRAGATKLAGPNAGSALQALLDAVGTEVR